MRQSRISIMLAVAAAHVVLSASRPCAAQATGAAATHPGSLTTAPDAQVGLAVRSGPQRQVAFAAADKLLAIVRRDDALARPIGYTVALSRIAGVTSTSQEGTPMPGQPPQFGVRGAIRYFAIEDNGRGAKEVTPSGESFSFSIVANGFGRITDMERISIPLDKGPPVLSAYRVVGEVHGHPIYEGDGDACAYISSRPQPPLIPLTKERYLRLMILSVRADSSRHEGQRAESGATPMADNYNQWLRDRPKREAQWRETYETIKKIDPAAADKFLSEMRKQEAALAADSTAARGQDKAIRDIQNRGNDLTGERLRGLQAQLDGLSAAERKQPMAVSMHGVDWDWRSDDALDISDPDASPLVEWNPTFFDKTLAPDVPQIIWVCMPSVRDLPDTEQRARDVGRIRDQLDWAALEALVRR